MDFFRWITIYIHVIYHNRYEIDVAPTGLSVDHWLSRLVNSIYIVHVAVIIAADIVHMSRWPVLVSSSCVHPSTYSCMIGCFTDNHHLFLSAPFFCVQLHIYISQYCHRYRHQQVQYLFSRTRTWRTQEEQPGVDEIIGFAQTFIVHHDQRSNLREFRVMTQSRKDFFLSK